MTSPKPWRPLAGRLLATALLACLSVGVHAASKQSIAVLNFELLNDNDQYDDAAMHEAQTRRLAQVSNEMREQFEKRGMYRVIDTAPAEPMIKRLRAEQSLLDCHGCELQIGRKLGADRIALGWVQKVSNLILNVNVKVEDVATGKVVYENSVDIRSNTDLSWKRGVDALVGHIADAKENLQ